MSIFEGFLCFRMIQINCDPEGERLNISMVKFWLHSGCTRRGWLRTSEDTILEDARFYYSVDNVSLGDIFTRTLMVSTLRKTKEKMKTI